MLCAFKPTKQPFSGTSLGCEGVPWLSLLAAMFRRPIGRLRNLFPKSTPSVAVPAGRSRVAGPVHGEQTADLHWRYQFIAAAVVEYIGQFPS